MEIMCAVSCFIFILSFFTLGIVYHQRKRGKKIQNHIIYISLMTDITYFNISSYMYVHFVFLERTNHGVVSLLSNLFVLYHSIGTCGPEISY